DCGAVCALLPHGQHTCTRGSPRSRTRAGQAALQPVRRAIGAPPAARTQPGQRRARRGSGRGSGLGRAPMTVASSPVLSAAATSLDRRTRMLRTAMGPLIAAALDDPDVVEVMLNPDGVLWLDRLSAGRAHLGTLAAADGERTIRLVAAHVGQEVHRNKPLLSAELPGTGERFEGVLPPVVASPTFALRKRAAGVIPLQQYVADGILSATQAEHLRAAVRERQNILVAGGTSSGKTTLANALL